MQLVKGKGSPTHETNIRVSELISVRCSQPASDRSHKPGGRLPLLSARPTNTSPAAEHHRPLAGTKLYCLVTEAHVCVNNFPGLHSAARQLKAEIRSRTRHRSSPMQTTGYQQPLNLYLPQLFHYLHSLSAALTAL